MIPSPAYQQKRLKILIKCLWIDEHLNIESGTKYSNFKYRFEYEIACEKIYHLKHFSKLDIFIFLLLSNDPARFFS